MKKFYQDSPLILIVSLFFGLCFCGAIYLVIDFFINKISTFKIQDLFVLLVVIFVIFFAIKTIISLNSHIIILKETEVFVKDQLMNKHQKVQYETHVPYKDIVNMEIIISTKNSQGKSIKYGVAPIKYIIFHLKDNKQSAIFINHFSKRKTIKILDQIIEKVKSSNQNFDETGQEIYNKYLSINNKRKIKF